MSKLLWTLPLLAMLACSSTPEPAEVPGTQAAFDLSADLTQPEHFYNFPWPSDLRLLDGKPDFRGFPNDEDNAAVINVLPIAVDRAGFSTLPAAYFQFSAPLASHTPDEVIPAEKSAPILLIDVDRSSPTRGALTPLVATTLVRDSYVPANLLGMAPRPGFILHPKRQYAFVVLRQLKDAAGNLLGVPLAMEQLKAGQTPAGARGGAVRELSKPAFETLQQLGVSLSDVAALTVFTTGDVVQTLADRSTRLKERQILAIENLKIDQDDGDHDRYCELVGTIRYPQFQKGTPPFDTEGRFELGADDLPIKQRDETSPVTLTLPKSGEMPANGFPLVVYVHGSGGRNTEAVDRGKTEVQGEEPRKGEGPAYVVAPFGIATAASAMPVNPERLPGATALAYLNFNNFAAFPSTFQQGVIEQRLFIDALTRLEIPPEALAGCNGLTLPNGATHFKFDTSKFAGMGQSMGGMYTNMVSAVEPRISAIVPTGAGGYWSYFILETNLVPGRTLLSTLLGIPAEQISFLHPVLQLVQTAWEPAEPLAYVPRVAKAPLPGAPVRPIYEPVGSADGYFPEPIFDAMALGFGNQQAGAEVWSTMQPLLTLGGLGGIASYPVKQNRTSVSGATYTGAVVQYPRDEIRDGHYIAFQLDEVKHQYSCFLSTFFADGVAVIPAPAVLGTPCPR